MLRTVSLGTVYYDTKKKSVVNNKELSVNVVYFFYNEMKFYAITTMYLKDIRGKEITVDIEKFKKCKVKAWDLDGKELTFEVFCEMKPRPLGTEADI
jgi:hypothetical protein